MAAGNRGSRLDGSGWEKKEAKKVKLGAVNLVGELELDLDATGASIIIGRRRVKLLDAKIVVYYEPDRGEGSGFDTGYMIESSLENKKGNSEPYQAVVGGSGKEVFWSKLYRLLDQTRFGLGFSPKSICILLSVKCWYQF
ncbi:hypothetical protein NPIL_368151 [Nephila pilipes]|uniref:Uncharacterized protein n=1 Tax=Nephila pilipes TaxID=299642 RepID=A0A8X6UPR3_NEPPI|nr:hypothetical protein NPIL_368151 [Nephila pilipes]